MKSVGLLIHAALVIGVAASFTPSTLAQSYPSRPVTVIVPFPVGGGGDFLARAFQERFAGTLGQPVIIENKAGAGGTIGTSLVARAAPDGYTLLLGNIGTHAINSAVYKKLPYDPVKDFAPISQAVNIKYAVVVGRKLNVASLSELIAMARQNPGKLSFGSGGNGTGAHLGGELLKQSARIDLLHVPYKGGGPMLQDLIGGQIDLTVSDIPTLVGQVKAKNLRVLAVTSSERAAVFPDAPTSAEAGLPGLTMYAWQALYAPAGTPAAIIQRIHAAFVQALNSPDVRERIAMSASDIVAGTPAELAAFQEKEMAKWAKVTATAGLTPE